MARQTLSSAAAKKPEFFEVVADNKDTERAEYLQTMKSLIEQAQEF